MEKQDERMYPRLQPSINLPTGMSETLTRSRNELTAASALGAAAKKIRGTVKATATITDMIERSLNERDGGLLTVVRLDVLAFKEA